MSRVNPHPFAVEARRIAKAAGLVVFEDAAGATFTVARKLPDGRCIPIGKRSSPEGLRSYVRRLARAH